MAIYKVGSTGADVAAIQSALAQNGFSPGKPDGVFGEGTKAAVISFQRSNGMLDDGIVGAVTYAALFALKPADPNDDTPLFTVDLVQKMFPSTPRANIVKYLPAVLEALRKQKLAEAPMVLMALATVRAETESFVPVVEGISKYNTSPKGSPFDLYDNRRDLGNRGKPDGSLFPGRGFVQLTGRDNYATYGAQIGVDLVAKPARASSASVASDLLAVFIKSNERTVKKALLEGDLRYARRIVNGGSHGLDRFTDAYKRGIVLLPAGTCDNYRDAVK